MANMSYCRFENTSRDIRDCIDALEENNWDLAAMMEDASSKQEARAMKSFVNLCIDIAENFEDDPILS